MSVSYMTVLFGPHFVRKLHDFENHLLYSRMRKKEKSFYSYLHRIPSLHLIRLTQKMEMIFKHGSIWSNFLDIYYGFFPTIMEGGLIIQLYLSMINHIKWFGFGVNCRSLKPESQEKINPPLRRLAHANIYRIVEHPNKITFLPLGKQKREEKFNL